MIDDILELLGCWKLGEILGEAFCAVREKFGEWRGKA